MGDGDDTYTISGIRVGGRINTYGTAVQKKPPKVDIDESIRETKQAQPGGGGYGYEHPPGAFSLAYSFVPYHRPPPPPYQYQYPSPYGQHHQYPPPPPPWQQYVRYGGPPPQMQSYYGDYHGGHGYGPAQFQPPNQGGFYNYGRSAATGAPGYGHHGQQDTVNDQLGQDYKCGGGSHMSKGLPASGGAPAAAGAAANGGHQGQGVAVHKHDQHDLGHAGGAVAAVAAAAAAATTVCT